MTKSIYEQAKDFYEDGCLGTPNIGRDKWEDIGQNEQSFFMAGIMGTLRRFKENSVAAKPTPAAEPITENTVMWFGKHKGKKIKNIDLAYWQWMLDQDWFQDKYPELAKLVLSWRAKKPVLATLVDYDENIDDPNY